MSTNQWSHIVNRNTYKLLKSKNYRNRFNSNLFSILFYENNLTFYTHDNRDNADLEFVFLVDLFFMSMHSN